MMVLPFSLEAILLFLSNSISREGEHLTLSFLFYSYHCWQKYDSQSGIREYYCNARTNGLRIAPQEWSDKDSKAFAFPVVPVAGIFAAFLSVSLVMTVPSETFMFHTRGSYKSAADTQKNNESGIISIKCHNT